MYDKVTYYGFVATPYVLETDIVEFDYDSDQNLSITDTDIKYISAFTVGTVGTVGYFSFVLAPTTIYSFTSVHSYLPIYLLLHLMTIRFHH